MRDTDKRQLRSTPVAILTLALLVLAFLVRVWYIDADPPYDLTESSSVYTDPAQYTLSAKQYVQTGDINPYGEDRFAFFLKSTVTALAVLVFKLLGTGQAQSNLVGLLYSFGGLVLFLLFLRRTAGPLAGLFFLALILFDYNQVFYGRLPFLEQAMFFWSALAMFILCRFTGRIGHVCAGTCLATGVFFGKITGLPFLFAFACYLVYRAVYEGEGPDKFRWQRLIYFGGGWLLIASFWLVFSYLPQATLVSSYVGEQAIGLYGAPDGLKSIGGFVEKMVSFGYDPPLFPRMVAVSLLGACFLGAVFLSLSRHPRRDGRMFGLRSGDVFVAAMIIAFFGSLMIWNYRPLRYQLVLTYALTGAAGIVCSRLWDYQKEPSGRRTPWLFYLLCYPVVLVVVYQLYSTVMDSRGIDFAFGDKILILAFVAAVITFGIGLTIGIVRRGNVSVPPLILRIAVAAVVALSAAHGAVAWVDWWRAPTFTARDNSRDLAMTLGPGAVLSGPYAPVLTLENNLGTVIHMFGVAQADSALFDRFPVTHLLVDKGNEDRARNDYPRMMGGAVHVCTYHVGLKKVRLFRIAGRTANAQANGYRRSLLELAVDYYRADSAAAANEFALRHMRAYPANLTGCLMLGERTEQASQYAEAEMLFKKAVEFSPTSYNLAARLAMFYKNRYEATGDSQHRANGLRWFETAMKYAPGVHKIRKAYTELKGSRFGS